MEGSTNIIITSLNVNGLNTYESRMVYIYIGKQIPTLKTKKQTQIQKGMGNIMTSGDSLNLPCTKIKSTTKHDTKTIQCICP